MAASKHNITILQGATFDMSAVWADAAGAPEDLTDVLARMQVRKTHRSEEVLLSLDSDAIGGITLDVPTGTISVVASATQTAALPGRLRGVYDLELEFPGGRVVRLLQGRVTVDPEVTR